MNRQRQFLGALAQDLYRIANFIQTGAVNSAERFWLEAQQGIAALKKEENPDYLTRILADLDNTPFDPRSLEQGEKFLTYGVIFHSLAFHGFSISQDTKSCAKGAHSQE
jgi:hypothetical protein